MKLGELVNDYRKRNKLTMQDFANKANLSKGYISMLEKGQHHQSHRKLVPSFETYQKVANAMELSMDDLIAMLDGNETVRLNSTCEENDEMVLSTDELSLLHIYRDLDEKGQLKLISYGEGLLGSQELDYDEVRRTVDEILREEALDVEAGA